MTKDELIAKAEALGIDVDGRWSMKRIQEEIDAHEPTEVPVEDKGETGMQAGEAEPLSSDEPEDEGGVASPDEVEPAPLPTIAVTVLRDVWDAEGERHRAGTVRHVSVEDAMDGIESGIYSRVKG